jgi:Polysaccharide deacetylase
VICLSFDTDHLDEPRMREFVDTVRVPGAGTFFCTQRYEALSAPHEICPHPYLPEGADWDFELEAKRADFPEARGWRAHSCVYSHLLAQRIAADGYAYASAFDQFGRGGIEPSREAWGVWHLPIYYMDNLDFSLPRFWPGAAHRAFDPALIETVLADDGIYVFDFHPVHLLLNSTSAESYFERRGAFVAGAPLEDLRCTGYGARSFYDDLCTAMGGAGMESISMYDALIERVGASKLRYASA